MDKCYESKHELKEMIALDLRRRTPPKTRVATMVWDIDNQRILLDSHSKSVNEAFLTLFAHTFNIALDSPTKPQQLKLGASCP